MWLLTDIANWVDRRTEQAVELRNQVLNTLDPHHITGWNHPLQHGVPNLIGIMIAGQDWVARPFIQSTVDVLRLGDGVRSRTARGVGQDLLRVSNLLPVFGAGRRVIGNISRAYITQGAGTIICGPTSFFNALERSGNQAFTNLRQLLQFAGVRTARLWTGTPALEYGMMVNALRRLGIPIRILFSQRHRMEDLAAFVEANPNGVTVTTLSYIDHEGRAAVHTLEAMYDRTHRVLVFADTNGDVYYGIEHLLRTYREARIATAYPAVFIPRAVVALHRPPPSLNAASAAVAAASPGATGGRAPELLVQAVRVVSGH